MSEATAIALGAAAIGIVVFFLLHLHCSFSEKEEGRSESSAR